MKHTKGKWRVVNSMKTTVRSKRQNYPDTTICETFYTIEDGSHNDLARYEEYWVGLKKSLLE